VVATGVALKLAQDADLDLVEVAPDARPPVAKLMDFGKFKYESDMKAREARRNQANTVLKEIRFRLKIDPHDYGTKKGHVERFLAAGDKVKVMIMFRGREQSRPEMGVRLLQRLAEDVSELGFVESMPKQDGRNMTMVLGPVKKKADAKVEQRKRSTEINSQRKTKSEVKAEARAQSEAPQPVEAEQPVDVPDVEDQQAPAPEATTPAPRPEPAAPVEQTPAEEEPATQTAPAEQEKPASQARSAASEKPATRARSAASEKPATPARPAAAESQAKPAAAPARPAAATPRPATPKPGVPRPPAPRPKPTPRTGR
jgi:translation initiation factor IF-3